MGNFTRYLFFILGVGLLTVLLSSLIPGAYERLAGVSNVANIPVTGFIAFESDFLQGTNSIRDIILSLEQADNDPEIKAIMLDINSPGGYPVASYELQSAVSAVRKPVVSIIREVGASGAYWAAASSDYIIASELSTVGSIGVNGGYLEFSGLLDDFNVTYVRVVSGEQKDVGAPFRAVTAKEAADMQAMIDEMLFLFLNDVAQKRNLSDAQIAFAKTGAVVLGREGVVQGFVDEIGGSKELDAYLKSITRANKIQFVEYARQASLLESLLSTSAKQGVSFALDRAIVPFLFTHTFLNN